MLDTMILAVVVTMTAIGSLFLIYYYFFAEKYAVISKAAIRKELETVVSEKIQAESKSMSTKLGQKVADLVSMQLEDLKTFLGTQLTALDSIGTSFSPNALAQALMPVFDEKMVALEASLTEKVSESLINSFMALMEEIQSPQGAVLGQGGNAEEMVPFQKFLEEDFTMENAGKLMLLFGLQKLMGGQPPMPQPGQPVRPQRDSAGFYR